MSISHVEFPDSFVEPEVEIEYKAPDAIEHGQIIKLLALLGYKIEKVGMCFGISIMALIALLSKEIENFEIRNVILGQKLETTSIKELAKAIESIEAKRVNAIAGYKKELLIALGQDTQMSDAKFYRFIKSKPFKNNPHVIAYKKKYNELDGILNDEERALSDAHAYLEDICVSYFASSDFPGLYKKKDQVLFQDAETVITRVLPHQLVKKPNLKGLRRIKKLIKALTKEKSLVRKADVFVGLYTKEKLVDYLQELRLISRAFHHEPIVFMLHARQHSIVISFNPEKKCWYLIDANKLPSIKHFKNEEMAEELFSSFFSENTFVLTAEVFCNKKILEPLKKVIAERRETLSWKEIHAISGAQPFVDEDNNSLIIEAAKCGDTVVFNELLERRNPAVDINAVDGDAGRTAFNLAVRNGQTKIVDLMLKSKFHQPDPNILYLDRLSVLSLAVFNHDKKMIKRLLKIKNPKIKIDHFGHGSFTALQESVSNGDLDIMKMLIKAGANIQLKTASGESLMHLAISKNHLDIVEELLKRKVDLDVVSNHGETPLLLAIKNKNLRIVQALLDSKYHRINPAVGIKGTVSPLYKAAEAGDVEILKVLFANKELRNENLKGIDLLRAAVKQGHLDAVKFLLQNKEIKNISITAFFCLSMTAIMAIQYKQHAIFEMVMAYQGAWIDTNQAAFKDGSTLLHYAAQHNNLEALQSMLESKRFDHQINSQDREGETPLYVAVKHGDVNIVNALLGAGADPNKANKQGATPLIAAIREEKSVHISELLKCTNPPVNMNQLDKNSFTPLYHAVGVGNRDVVQLLLDSENPKVDPYLSVHGYSPLGLAAYNNKLDIVLTILNHDRFKAYPVEAYQDLIEAMFNAIDYDHGDIVKAMLHSEIFLSNKIGMAEHLRAARARAQQLGYTEIDKILSQFIREMKRESQRDTKPSVSSAKKSKSHSSSPLAALSVFSSLSPQVKLGLSVKKIDGGQARKRSAVGEQKAVAMSPVVTTPKRPRTVL